MDKMPYIPFEKIITLNGYNRTSIRWILHLTEDLYDVFNHYNFIVTPEEWNNIHSYFMTTLFYIGLDSYELRHYMLCLMYEIMFKREEVEDKIKFITRTSFAVDYIFEHYKNNSNKYDMLFKFQPMYHSDQLRHAHLCSIKQMYYDNYKKISKLFNISLKDVDKYTDDDWYNLMFEINKYNKDLRDKHKRILVLNSNDDGSNVIPNHRPTVECIILKIDKKTGNVIQEYPNREECIKDNNISKSTLSRILNTNDKLKSYKGYLYAIKIVN